MRRLEARPAFAPAPATGPLRRIPAGLAGGALLLAQLLLIVAGPIALAVLWAFLLAACAVGKRPVGRVILRAWPILLLAAITAFRRAGLEGTGDPASLVSHASVIWLRFCWMVLAADLFVSSFAWQSTLAGIATETASERAAGLFARARTAVALAVWLAIVQLPLIVGVLRARRDAARARGLRGPRALIASLITGILPQLLHRADTYAETLIARGVDGGTAINTNTRTSDGKHGIVRHYESRFRNKGI